MDVTLIAAKAANGVIGKGGKLPWNYPEDLRHFKEATKGHTVIMGRKTYESIGRPLPNRKNIVVSSTLQSPDVTVVPSLKEAFQECLEDEEVFIIGGQNIYQEALDNHVVDKMLITEIKQAYEGDVFFPEIEDTWRETSRESHAEFDFVTYVRI